MALKDSPLGRIEVILVFEKTSRSGRHKLTGKVRVLERPSITLTLPAPGKAFTDHLNHQLQQVASILAGAKSISCTAYAGSGGSSNEASSQAAKACNKIRQSGFSGTIQSAGKQDSKRRLVISFKF